VFDLSGESKNTWRHFITEFCNRLMELRPAVQRHIFLEEAPEFIPQRPMGEQKRSLAAVDSLTRLGRNRGYGATIISQRFATVNKDVLTQCENIIALRSIGLQDRRAAEDWIAECVGQSESAKKAEKFLESLTGLPDGQGWFWSPQWLKEFAQIRLRRRKTYHPGETRAVGQTPKQVQLSDVREFVERFGQVLAKAREKPKLKVSKSGAVSQAPISEILSPMADYERFRDEGQQLRSQNAELHRRIGAAEAALNAVRSVMEPQYRAMQKLFSELDAVVTSNDFAAYEPWKQKLGGACSRMIEALAQRGELTRIQLATLTSQSPRSGSFATNLARLNTNGLIEKNGDKIRLRPL
jgi:hypothetical protein